MAGEYYHARPGQFGAALEFTAAQTGFSARLIEKDYWCSLILRELFASGDHPLVFKGGTLLSKAFAGFDRLSEDLDFTLPTPNDSTRSQRSRKARELQANLNVVVTALALRWSENWCGHNDSRQYRGRLEYPSIFGHGDSILVEVGQREAVLRAVEALPLQTMLLNPLFGEPALPVFNVCALSRPEAYAEKVRAALTRDVPAIRDLYDFWQGLRGNLIPMDDGDWIALVRQKCDGLDLTACCSDDRRNHFHRGLETELRPVLRAGAIDEFPLADAWDRLRALHARLTH